MAKGTDTHGKNKECNTVAELASAAKRRIALDVLAKAEKLRGGDMTNENTILESVSLSCWLGAAHIFAGFPTSPSSIAFFLRPYNPLY